MANKRIKDLAEKSTFASGDYFPVDNNNGTKKVDAGKITVPLGNISGSADAYSSTKAYKVGELVIHNNMLYKCTTACSAGTWQTNQGYFTATTLTSEVTNVNSSLSILGNDSTDTLLQNGAITGTAANPQIYTVLNKGIYKILILGGTSVGSFKIGNIEFQTHTSGEDCHILVLKAGTQIKIYGSGNYYIYSVTP